jgi:nucleoside-diphosphate-sugar epimerase
LNLGTSRLITINALVDLVSEIAGKKLVKRHDLTGPQGVRGRNSDNTRVYAALDWEPLVSLEEGIATSFHWIESELIKEGRLPAVASR